MSRWCSLFILSLHSPDGLPELLTLFFVLLVLVQLLPAARSSGFLRLVLRLLPMLTTPSLPFLFLLLISLSAPMLTRDMTFSEEPSLALLPPCLSVSTGRLTSELPQPRSIPSQRTNLSALALPPRLPRLLDYELLEGCISLLRLP